MPNYLRGGDLTKKHGQRMRVTKLTHLLDTTLVAFTDSEGAGEPWRGREVHRQPVGGNMRAATMRGAGLVT